MATGSSEKVYAYLLDMLLKGELKPGEKIAEQRLAEMFDTSRTPVREALIRLQGDGLVEIYPKRFVQVKQIDNEELRNIGLLRITMDRAAVRMALLRASKEELLYLKKIAEDCLDAYRRNDTDEQRKLDGEFHRYLSSIGKNPELLKIYDQLYLRVRFLQAHHEDNVIKDEEVHLLQHLELADALLNGDQDRAFSVLASHLSAFYDITELVDRVY